MQYLFMSFSSCPIQKITHQTLSQIIDTAAGNREAGAVCQVQVPPFDRFDAGDVYQVGDGGFDEAFIGQNRGDYLVEGLPQGDALDDGAVLQMVEAFVIPVLHVYEPVQLDGPNAVFRPYGKCIDPPRGNLFEQFIQRGEEI